MQTVKINKIGKLYKCCILCLKSPIKIPALKLQRHFDETCYTHSGYRLKSDTIPKKYLKGQIIRPFFRLSEDKTMNLKLEKDELSIQPSTPETIVTVNISSEIKESTQPVISLPSTPELAELQKTPKKRKRFISEIKTPDFATPKS